jgi:phytoene desaturase
VTLRGEHPDYDVIVIGAGLGGLASAGVLARRGFKTAVFEQAPRVGGCCGSVRHGDYQFDVGATVVLFLEVIEQYFERVGRKLSERIEFLPIDPVFHVIDRDRRHFDIPTSAEETGRIFASLSAADGEAWKRYVHTAETGMAKSMTQMFTKPLQSFADMAASTGSGSGSGTGGNKRGAGAKRSRPRPPRDLKFFFKSFESTLRSFFENDSILGALSVGSYSVGLPPALAPGYAAFLGYAEHQGSYYPRGGMGAIPEAMAQTLREDKGEVWLESSVVSILEEGGRAIGVRLKDGREVRARVVISDINAKRLYGGLLPTDRLPRWARRAVRSLPLSQSTAMLKLGIEGDEGFGGHHTIFTQGMEEMNRIWFEDYEKGHPARGGYLLASMPSFTDASLAPAGHHVVHLHTLAPYTLAGGASWDDIREEQCDAMLDFLEQKYGLALRDRIRFMALSTPTDLEREAGLYRGAVYGLESSLMMTAVFRPRMRSSVLGGLYLAGSSVHLGGGIPVCLGSGMIAADMVSEDL